MPNYFRTFEKWKVSIKNKVFFYFRSYTMYKFHNSYFVIWGKFVVFNFLDFGGFLYVYIYITIRRRNSIRRCNPIRRSKLQFGASMCLSLDALPVKRHDIWRCADSVSQVSSRIALIR